MRIILPAHLIEEIKHITDEICNVTNPEYVILFGTLVGGTQQSEVPAYDILISTKGNPQYTREEIIRHLQRKIPLNKRNIANINLYVYNQYSINSVPSIFFNLAKYEGILLYCCEDCLFVKPTINYNDSDVLQKIKQNYITLFNLSSQTLNDSLHSLKENNLRLAAFHAAKAANSIYKTLFFVFHNFEIDSEDIRILHRRVRTLSSELKIFFDTPKLKYGRTLIRLHYFQYNSLCSPNFMVTESELTDYQNQIKQLINIVEKVCLQRLEMYKNLN